MGHHLTDDERREIVDGWRDSGLSARRYCREHGLCVASLRRWAARTSSATPTSFVRLEVGPRLRELVVEAGGARIVVTRGFDAELLREVVAALRGTP